MSDQSRNLHTDTIRPSLINILVRAVISTRLPFLFFAFANLLVGLFAGLVRIGWRWDASNLASSHGSIMVGGFLGTLILVEKSLPLKKKYLLILAAVNASSIVWITAGQPGIGIYCLLVGACTLVWTLFQYLRKQIFDLPLVVMFSGSVFLLSGHVLLLATGLYPLALSWWMAFIVFTIAGERLELSKFLPVGLASKSALVISLGLFVASLLIPYHPFGKYVSGAALILIATWLMRFDVISIGLKKGGLIRFSAVALLGGYCALLLTGAFMISLENAPFAYDIVVHTFFLGFVFSMIFAHGPIILPGVLGIGVRPYHPGLFAPLILLWFSLFIRLSSDLFWIPFEGRLISGWMSALSIFLYFILVITCTIRMIRRA